MTPQEIYDHVVPRLLKQNARALSGDSCVLIADDGKRCAFGMLLPSWWTADNMYIQEQSVEDYFESIGVRWNTEEHTIEMALFEIHNYRQPREWPALFKAAAKDFGLKEFIQ